MSDIHVRVRLGGEAYAIDVDHVIEVAELGAVSPVPGSNDSLLGIRNLRGEIMPVFDLASVLGIAGDGLPQCLLITEQGGLRAGFAIDEVTDVGTIPPVTEETHSPLLAGAALDESALIGVVDLARVFPALSVERA
jgi:chemotaxis signal transduction protein